MGVPSGAQMSMPSCMRRTLSTGSTRIPKPDTTGAPGIGYDNDAVRGGEPDETSWGNVEAGAVAAGFGVAVVTAGVGAGVVADVVAVVGREAVATGFGAALVGGAAR